MKRTTLKPRDAAWLAETFDRNRSLFGGWRMEAGAGDSSGGSGGDPSNDKDGDKDAGSDDDFKSDHSKRAVLADLAEERKARQALEKEIGDLKKSIAQAFGIKDEGDKGDDVLSTVQQQLADLQRDNAVLALANEHGITEKADIDLLKQSRLEGDALTAMAERLKPAETPSGTPKPDGSQGGKGEPSKPETLPGVPRLAQAFEDAFNTN